VDDGERTLDGLPENVETEKRGRETKRVARPEQVDVRVGLDVGTEEHYAEVLDDRGERIFARSLVNDQADLEALLNRAAEHGTPGFVIDQPGSIAQRALAVARSRGMPVGVRARAGHAPGRRAFGSKGTSVDRRILGS
jgi:Transposase